MGKDLTPFPYVMILPQDRHEEILIKKLSELGVEVERNTELVSLEQNEEKVTVGIRLPSGDIQMQTADYLAGCDGAHSTVRKCLNISFAGGTYPRLFYVADVEGEGPALNGELHVSLDQAEFLAFFPLKEKGHARLIGVIREDQSSNPEWKDVSNRIIKEMNVHIDKVNWFSTYHAHHRVAEKFQKGRAFLLGDAGHIHSPVGGQGMNTGIGDAVNLAWKLGDVIKKKSPPRLLETYESERMSFARQLVHTTDNAFRFVSSDGPIAGFVRTRIVPQILPRLFRLESASRFLFRMISQTAINYRKHPSHTLSKIQPGDRLPWIESVNNYRPLQSLDWQIHIYGDRPFKSNLVIHHFKWNEEMEEKGLQKDKAYLIRPDGYIGEINDESI